MKIAGIDDLVNRFDSKRYELTKMGDGTAVLLSIETGKIISLNEVGTSIVDHLTNSPESKITTAELMKRLISEYDVAAEELERDMLQFINELSENL